MSLRLAFVQQASASDANLSALCAQFGISRPTGYRWLRRYQAGGAAALTDHSRRPHTSPAQTPVAQEQQVVALRTAHPAWGGRKLRARLLALTPDPDQPVPAASTLTAIVRRQGFAHPAPNDLWQLDFKGPLPLSAGAAGARCHPLSVLDDHARFAVGLVACADERTATVQAALTRLFRQYGLPRRVLYDTGPALGGAGWVRRPGRPCGSGWRAWASG